MQDHQKRLKRKNEINGKPGPCHVDKSQNYFWKKEEVNYIKGSEV